MSAAASSRFLRSAFLAVVVAALPLNAAGAASLLAKNFYLTGPNYDGVLPLCDDPSVSGQIASQFSHKESTYWNSSLQIQSWDRIGEIGYRPWGASYIPRRFCQARVLTSDGVQRSVSFSVREDLGLIGFSWGVEWCVSGTDRNLAYAPDCRQARP